MPFPAGKFKWFENRNDIFHTIKRVERLQTIFAPFIADTGNDRTKFSIDGVNFKSKLFHFIKDVFNLLLGRPSFHHDNHRLIPFYYVMQYCLSGASINDN